MPYYGQVRMARSSFDANNVLLARLSDKHHLYKIPDIRYPDDIVRQVYLLERRYIVYKLVFWRRMLLSIETNRNFSLCCKLGVHFPYLEA